MCDRRRADVVGLLEHVSVLRRCERPSGCWKSKARESCLERV